MIRRLRLKGGEVLLTLVGSTGQSFIAPNELAGWNVPRAIAVIRTDEEIGAKWINICLQSKETMHFLDVRANTTVQKTLNLKDVRDIPILIPPLDIKQSIEGVALSLSDKIELNRQTNQTLEQIAQAIFKSWFVDFEPTRAKIAAKKHWQAANESIETSSPTCYAEQFENTDLTNISLDEAMAQAAMGAISGKTIDQLDQLNPEQQKPLKTTAALFPDMLIDSELGDIPEGWGISDLKSVTIELRRGISPKYSEEKGVLVVNQKCIRNHSVNFDLARFNDPSKRKIDGRQIELGDVLVNSTGVGTLGRLAHVRFLPELTVFDSHVTVVRADTVKISRSFLAGLMLEKEKYIEASGTGSTGQTELRKQALEEIIFVNPPIMAGQMFESIISPMNRQIAELEQQQKILSKIRDSLLPKLLSGELSMGEAESRREEFLA